MKQLPFHFRQHGGKRKNAGRPAKNGKAGVSHLARPKFARITPAHVTLRVRSELPSLRSSRRFAAIKGCFAKARDRFGVRIVEFSVLGNHLHLIVEADSSEALSQAMQGLCIRLAKRLNAEMARKGALFADHYHSVLLRNPAQLANAIRYVLTNAAHHFGSGPKDWASSAVVRDVVAEPRGWLLRVGWKL
jgi:REP element-mobilizing transposase RayT